MTTIHNRNIIVLGIGRYKPMAKKIAENLAAKAHKKVAVGKLEEKRFPDGERYHRIASDVHNNDVVLVGGTIDDRHTLDMYDLGCAAAKYGAASLHLVIPYFGYSTMERAVQAGEVVKAKTRARLLSVIPECHTGNHVYMVDLHSEGIPHYIEGNLESHHIYAEGVIIDAIKELGGKKKYVVASTDAGRAKWVETLAKKVGVPASFCLKNRDSDGNLSLVAVSAHVKGKHVIIYDDMIRTGGSLIQAAQAYKDAGATGIDVIATHGIFPNNSLKKIKDSGLITNVVVTNTYPQRKGDIIVKPLEELLAKSVLKNLNE